MIKIISTLFVLLSCQLSFALDYPKNSKFDHRVRSTQFNATDVVQITGIIGIATHIKVEEGERYVTHAFGDSTAWEFANTGSNYFIKPRADEAVGNLTLITNRRAYYFRLGYKSSRNAKAIYALHFTYPDTEKRKKKAAKSLASMRNNLKRKGIKGVNLDYTMGGDHNLAPMNVWDNGAFTYFKFPVGQDLPTIYKRQEDGSESIVNRHGEGQASNIIVMHNVSKKWVLRLGNSAMAVFNESKSSIPNPNKSGTVSEKVVRKIKTGSF